MKRNNNIESREEFEKMLLELSKDRKELDLDAFDRDAVEGWLDSKVPFSELQKLDHKMGFNKKSYTGYVIAVTVLVIAVASLLVFQQNNESPTKTPIPTATIELAEAPIPAEIEQMTVLPKEEQISVQEVKKSQAQIQQQPIEQKNDLLLDIPFPTTALEPLPPTIEQKPVQITKQKTAKEIYLSDLKAIDYTQYRSKPQVEIEQYILTGVPANKEDSASKTMDEPTTQIIQIPYMDYLAKTLKYTNQGKWKLALSRYQEILNTYPDDVNARFYSAWCLYNLGQFSEACTNFSACLQLEYSNFSEEAEWYLAESRLANGEKTAAKELFTKIKNQKGFYSKQAEKNLKNWK